ncbi:Unknown protein, partial [Striga hermonthica]
PTPGPPPALGSAGTEAVRVEGARVKLIHFIGAVCGTRKKKSSGVPTEKIGKPPSSPPAAATAGRHLRRRLPENVLRSENRLHHWKDLFEMNLPIKFHAKIPPGRPSILRSKFPDLIKVWSKSSIQMHFPDDPEGLWKIREYHRNPLDEMNLQLPIF